MLAFALKVPLPAAASGGNWWVNLSIVGGAGQRAPDDELVMLVQP